MKAITKEVPGLLSVVCVLFLAMDAGAAALKLPSIFADNMVLQRDVSCNVWGWGEPGSKITVVFNGQSKATEVGADGSWSLKLDPLKVLKEGKPLVVKQGSTEARFKNVVVGDVWICGGQSNMGVGVERLKTAAPELWREIIETTDYPNLRYLAVKEVYFPFEEQQDVSIATPWTPMSRNADLERIRPSGIGFFFARTIHRELDIPIGFIRSNIGSTGAEAWMSRTTLGSHPQGRIILDDWARMQKQYSLEAVKEYIAEEITKAEAQGDTEKAKRYSDPLHWPKEPIKSKQHPSCGFNGMIAPITKFSIKGIIWDQGEGNVNRAWQYRELMPLTISDWRKYWRQGNGAMAETLPFYQVQIQDWRQVLDRGTESPSTGNAEAEIRDAQRHVADSTENCEMVCTIDHHEKGNTHPLLKNIPGERLAAVALAKTYGKEIQWRGPTFKHAEVEGDKIRVYFDGIGEGLMVGNRDGHHVQAQPAAEELDYFAIAGADNKFFWAKARMDGDTVLVWNKNVRQPRYVRYAWEANPEGCNLYNRDGWPAPPFRSDDLPYATRQNEKPFRKTDRFVWH